MSAGLSGFLNGFADQRKAQKAEKEREEDRALRREAIAAADRTSERGLQAARAGRGLPEDLGVGGAAPAIPQGEMPAMIRAGLIQRGMPEHIADAFVLNIQDESGFRADAIEGASNVHGTRGFGLYQLTDTKPGVGRRSEYERFAKARGADFGDVDTQLDFLMHELGGSEASAWKAIQAAPDTGSAAAAIVSKFLRPAAVHRDRRVAKYTGAPMPAAQSAQPRSLPAPAAPASAPPQVAEAPAPGVARAPRSFSITPGAVRPWSAIGALT